MSPDELDSFKERGYVRLKGAFPRDAALSMQDAMWRELREEFGIDRNDRASWRQPPRDIHGQKTDSAQRAMNTERLLGACGQLVETDRYEAPAHWGRVLVTFPETSPRPWEVPTGVWHWDCELHDNVGAVTRLVVFTFFSDVEPEGGGTLIVEGSPRLLQRFHDELPMEDRRQSHRQLRNRFFASHPWLKHLTGLEPTPEHRNTYLMGASHDVGGIAARVVELTGQPGDAVVCHPLMVHTTGPNHSDVPRFMRIRFPGESRRRA